jgi:hypothetical protein
MAKTFAPPQQPTFYFIGVTTARSAVSRVFAAWMQTLERPDVQLVGLDFPLHDEPANYRAYVEFLKQEPLALGGLVLSFVLHIRIDEALCHRLAQQAAALR